MGAASSSSSGVVVIGERRRRGYRCGAFVGVLRRKGLELPREVDVRVGGWLVVVFTAAVVFAALDENRV